MRLGAPQVAGNPTLNARSSPLLDELAKRAPQLFGALIGLAVLLRVLLAVFCPVPFGYVWDLYYRGIALLYTTGHIPGPTECWACNHPPVFFLLGWPLYALGMWLRPGDSAFALRFVTVLPVACGVITTLYAYRLLQALRFDRAHRVLGAALILTFPCLVISSYGVEADIVLTAWMAVFVYYLVLYHLDLRYAATIPVVRLGLLAGLAMLTKYSGGVALVTALIVVALRATSGRRKRALFDGALLVAASLTVCGWKFVDNLEQQGTLFAAHPVAAPGYALANRQFYWEIYHFATFRPDKALSLFGPHAGPGTLTQQPIYYSVPTSLHAQAWTDMSFFSVRGRHGLKSQPYPDKQVPKWVVGSVLMLGVVPSVLALVGLLATIRRRMFRPLLIYVVVGLSAYTWWFTAQMTWSVKTKYILFLLPAYVCYVLLGLRVLQAWRPWTGQGALVLLLALIALCHLYLFTFAVG